MPAASPLARELHPPDIKLLRDTLAGLRCPRFGDSVWVAPFEKLAGAGYALLAAEKYGYSHRDQRRFTYHGRIREEVVRWLAGYAFPKHASDTEAQNDILSGFYFNAATARLVWAAERLVVVFAALPCPCGVGAAIDTNGQRLAFLDVWKAAAHRLEHLGTEHRLDLLDFGLVVLQCSPDRHLHEPEFNPDTTLAMLRFDVSHHRRTTRTTEVKPGAPVTWSNSGPMAQANAAADCFALLCRAYNELEEWQPAARQNELPALGEFA